MNRLELTLFVQPTPKGRPKAAKIGNHIRMYTPGKTAKAEGDIRAAIRTVAGEQGMFGSAVPLFLDVTFYRERPKSAPKKLKYPITKPDLDNYLKALLDALNKFLFPDDAQIVTMISRKRFAEPGSCPRIDLKVWVHENQEGGE